MGVNGKLNSAVHRFENLARGTRFRARHFSAPSFFTRNFLNIKLNDARMTNITFSYQSIPGLPKTTRPHSQTLVFFITEMLLAANEKNSISHFMSFVFSFARRKS